MKIKPSIQKKILSDYGNYLLTHGERPKISTFLHKKITLMKKNFINSFQVSNIWRKKF